MPIHIPIQKKKPFSKPKIKPKTIVPDLTALVIGNKPYAKIDLSPLIDRFPSIYRCNMSSPNRNNGTKYGKLGLCIHLYNNLIRNKITKAEFHRIYGK